MEISHYNEYGVTSERFLPSGGAFRAILTSESQLLQPVLVFSVHSWPTPAGAGSVFITTMFITIPAF